MPPADAVTIERTPPNIIMLTIASNEATSSIAQGGSLVTVTVILDKPATLHAEWLLPVGAVASPNPISSSMYTFSRSIDLAAEVSRQGQDVVFRCWGFDDVSTCLSQNHSVLSCAM